MVLMGFYPIIEVIIINSTICTWIDYKYFFYIHAGNKERNSTTEKPEKPNDDGHDALLPVKIAVPIVICGIVISGFVFYKYEVWQRIVRLFGGNRRGINHYDNRGVRI